MLAADQSDPSLTFVLIPVVVGGLLAGVAGLIGAWYGRRSEQRNEHQIWLRNERLKAYSRLAATLTDKYEAAAARSAGYPVDTASTLGGHLEPLNVVRLLGPKELMPFARAASTAANDLFNASREGVSDGQFKARMGTAELSQAAFVEKAKEVLGIT